MNENNTQNKKEDEKIVITSSGFMEWLKCPKRFYFEKEESGIKPVKKVGEAKSSELKIHKWLQK